MTIAALLSESLQLLWPARCAGCDRVIPDPFLFCGACSLSLSPLVGTCPGCALPQPDGNPHGGRCAICRRAPFPFAAATVPLEYGEALAAGIVRMKHGGRRDLARRLARLLVRPLADALARGRLGPADAVVPVPLHARKLRQRGFNQALELGRWALAGLARQPGLAPARGLPSLERRLLLRIRPTRELGRAGPGARLAEVAGAFAVADRGRVLGRRFLLVDDVFTTGATFSECAATLRAAGARSIDVLALARAV
jgi:predicted amidophosphoribosyltransferase